MFITFEGPEGSGKTSQVAALGEHLQRLGYPVLVTREPGGTSIGDQVRAVLMKLGNTEMHPRTEILLFQASRAQLVQEVIRPRLAANELILCDRYADSTLAYQGYGHQQFTLAELRPLIEFATCGLKPNLTILLDIDVELGLQRRIGQGDWTRMDAFDPAFHQRVRQGFLELAQAEPDRWQVIDASRSFEQVQADLRAAVLDRLDKNRQGPTGYSR